MGAAPTTPATPTSSSTAPVLPSPGPDLSLAGIVVDSAFTDLEGLAQELVRDGKLLPMAVPGVVVSGALRMIRGTARGLSGIIASSFPALDGFPQKKTWFNFFQIFLREYCGVCGEREAGGEWARGPPAPSRSGRGSTSSSCPPSRQPRSAPPPPSSGTARRLPLAPALPWTPPLQHNPTPEV